MSVCAPCLVAKNIPRCLTNLIVGTVANSTAYKVYIRNIATGDITQFSATSSLAGLLTVVLGDLLLMDGIEYELWVVLASATSVEAREQITVSGDVTPTTCVSFTAIPVTEADGDPVLFTNVTLQAA
jgi:hypothetical protein